MYPHSCLHENVNFFEVFLEYDYFKDIYKKCAVIKCFEKKIISIVPILISVDSEKIVPKQFTKTGWPKKKRIQSGLKKK